MLGIRHADGTTGDVRVVLRTPTLEQPGALGIRASAVATVGTIDNSFVEAVQLGAKRTVQAFSLVLVGPGRPCPLDRQRSHGGAAGGPARSGSRSSWATSCGASGRCT